MAFLQKNRNKLLIMAFTIMLMNGVVNNLRGQIGPFIIEQYSLSYSKLGFLFSFFSIGSMVVFFFTGKLIERFGLVRLLLGGLVTNFIALSLFFWINSYYLLILAFTLIGIGLTILNISAVNLVSISYSKKRGKMINLLHLFYGIGGISAPYFVTVLIKNGFSWSSSFLFSLIFVIIIGWQFKLVSLPQIEVKTGKQQMDSTLKLLQNRRVTLFALIVFLQVGVEFSMVTWLAPFLKNFQGRSELAVSFHLSLFFIAFTVGRFIASLLVEKFGYYNFLLFNCAAAILFINTAVIGGYNYTILLPLSGIFLAVQVPTTQAAIFDSFSQNGIKVVGFSQTAGMIGSTVLSNWLLGFVNDFFNLKASFIALILVLIISFLATYRLKQLS
ncbi:Fucose permease [Halanaerobium salsuginis]|uniref:Fucose permease n=1 Tax=Halanaerobium salsuginis TaxID=29563 RepID=A0A1I4JXJ9_9FIRM|nr:Fucose permease [Halanaerobium salsuginis]